MKPASNLSWVLVFVLPDPSTLREIQGQSKVEAQAQDGEFVPSTSLRDSEPVELSNHESGNYNELDARLSLAKLEHQCELRDRQTSFDLQWIKRMTICHHHRKSSGGKPFLIQFCSLESFWRLNRIQDR
jgi:hypothetical protein